MPDWMIAYLVMTTCWFTGFAGVALAFGFDGHPRDARVLARLSIAAPGWPVLVAYAIGRGLVALWRIADLTNGDADE